MDISHIIKLMENMEEKCIVVGPDDKAYILLPLEDYEKLVLAKPSVKNKENLTGRELIDKINRDIALLQEEHIREKVDKLAKNSVGGLFDQDLEEKYYLEPIEDIS